MKIYLAGSCGSEDRTLMKRIATALRDRNKRLEKHEQIEVYCPFELQIPNAWDMSQENWAREVFKEDVKAIKDCDIMVSISMGRESTAGTNWEQGYAFALNKPIYVFQITDKPTSLMTYCGCTYFWNTSKENVVYDILNIVIDGNLPSGAFLGCKTVLT